MNKKDLIYIGLIVVLFLLLVNTCEKKVQNTNEVVDYINYKDTVKYYKTKSGELVAYNDALRISEKNLRMMNDSLDAALKDLKIKKPAVITQVKTVFRVDTLSYYFTDTLPCADFTMKIGIDSVHYKFGFTITKDFFRIDSVRIPNKQSIVVGEKKNGIFKKNEYVITVQNENPNMEVTGLTSYVITKKESLAKKGLFLTIGVFSGIILHRTLSR
jgi:hypothetical protein